MFEVPMCRRFVYDGIQLQELTVLHNTRIRIKILHPYAALCAMGFLQLSYSALSGPKAGIASEATNFWGLLGPTVLGPQQAVGSGGQQCSPSLQLSARLSFALQHMSKQSSRKMVSMSQNSCGVQCKRC